VPEGDTIKRAEATLAPLLVGRKLAAVYDHGLRRGALAGRTVEAVRAVGKHLLVELEGGFTIRVHLGIAGAWRRRRAAELRETEARAATLALVTDEDALLAVKARAAEIVRTAFVHAHPALTALGPDLLGEGALDLPAIVARARARAEAEPTLTVGELLLDQRVAAGLGNVYKSELCFLARLHPHTRAAHLTDDKVAELYARGAALLRANVGPWPRTTTANRARGALPARGRGRYFVYGRARRPCTVCGVQIVRVLDGAETPRPTYFCPSCQPPPAR